jgi:hypothetical protein
MKVYIRVLLLLGIMSLMSCSSVRVVADYDKEVDFKMYNSFAFFKPGIDEAKISDLDKKRILRAIERELVAKGMFKVSNPDLLISIFTETRENVNIHQNNFGYGWGWNPYFSGFGGNNIVSSNIEGTLYIDFIDARKNELVWQGLGTGILSLNMKKKEEKINKIVNEILEEYPPERDQK